MLNKHAQLGIAQIVFYVPIVPLAIYLLIRNWSYRPRMAWWPMVPLSLMRLAGGACIIALEKKPSTGLIIAAIILLNVGAIPLIVNELGFVRAVLMDNFSHVPSMPKIVKLMRLSFVPAIGLLAAGGGIVSTQPNLGRILTLVGYALFAALLCTLIGIELYLLRISSTLIPSSRKILIGGLAAAPFLIVRNIYGILEVADENSITNTWSPVIGSTVAFAIMALLMEYVAICIWLWVGYTMPPDRGVRSAAADLEGGK